MLPGNERVKVHRPIIYGSQARLLSEEERAKAPPGHTHKWTIFLTSAATPPPEPKSSTDAPPTEIDMDYIPGGEDDMSYLIKRVVFRLHDTYPTPNRMCEKPPYQVSETGWGEFTVQIKITFVPEAGEKAITLQHPIKLHHWGEPIEAPPAITAVGTPTGTPAPTNAATGPAATPGNVSTAATDDIKEAKAEPDTPVEPSVPATTTAEQSEAPTEASTDAATGTATPAVDSTTVATPSGTPAATGGGVAAIPTVASTYPVHSWQYDELVFSDPPQNFLQILEEHPPTPLPARNRRPRDQREQHDQKTGNSKKKRAISRVGSRAGTETRQGTPVTPMTPQTPIPGQVGVPGEPGSADVPLEFSLEMEKGELNKLTETRIRIVQEMDRWRERLISQEKELSKLKEELRG